MSPFGCSANFLLGGHYKFHVDVCRLRLRRIFNDIENPIENIATWGVEKWVDGFHLLDASVIHSEDVHPCLLAKLNHANAQSWIVPVASYFES